MTKTNAELSAELKNLVASLHSHVANIDLVGQVVLASGGSIRIGPPPPPIKVLRETIEGAEEDLQHLTRLIQKLVASGMLHADP